MAVLAKHVRVTEEPQLVLKVTSGPVKVRMHGDGAQSGNIHVGGKGMSALEDGYQLPGDGSELTLELQPGDELNAVAGGPGQFTLYLLAAGKGKVKLAGAGGATDVLSYPPPGIDVRAGGGVPESVEQPAEAHADDHLRAAAGTRRSVTTGPRAASKTNKGTRGSTTKQSGGKSSK